MKELKNESKLCASASLRFQEKECAIRYSLKK